MIGEMTRSSRWSNSTTYNDPPTTRSIPCDVISTRYAVVADCLPYIPSSSNETTFQNNQFVGGTQSSRKICFKETALATSIAGGKMASQLQFVEFADTERPGIKLVSSKQVANFITDTSYGVVLYVVVCATSPNLIESNPQFFCDFSLGSSVSAEGIQFKTIAPSQKADYTFITKTTTDEGTSMTVARSIDQNSVFPVKILEGTIYFQVTKLSTQRPFSQSLRIQMA